jgi:hypothetical protein
LGITRADGLRAALARVWVRLPEAP